MTTYVKIIGGLYSRNLGGLKSQKIWLDIGQLSSLITNILETDRDIKSQEQT